MSSLEGMSRKRARKANLKMILLDTVKAAGVLGIALVAPNVLGALHKLGFIDTKRREESISAARKRMIQQGLLTTSDGFILLTKKGEKELRRLTLSQFAFVRPKRWDGKWRVLIFDVPNYKKGLRDKLRHSLIANGFQRLQHSVWVVPHNCEDFVTLLKAELRIGKDVQYLIVDSIENDYQLRKDFGIS